MRFHTAFSTLTTICFSGTLTPNFPDVRFVRIFVQYFVALSVSSVLTKKSCQFHVKHETSEIQWQIGISVIVVIFSYCVANTNQFHMMSQFPNQTKCNHIEYWRFAKCLHSQFTWNEIVCIRFTLNPSALSLANMWWIWGELWRKVVREAETR